ncbi:hypothetical protein ABPG75_007455 [Micractinium tetrahymenae]
MASQQLISTYWAALLLLAVGLAAAAPWTVDSFPSISDTASCGRPGVPKTAVCDPDDLLSAKSKDYVDGVISAIAAGEAPYKLGPCADKQAGYQVAVAVMRSMAVPAGSTPAQAAPAFAKQLHTRWGVGDAACHNGVLLLLSVEDRQVYINTGAGASAALPDDRIQDIIRDMRPALKGQDYSAAVERGVVDIGLGLAGGKPKGEGIDLFTLAFFGVFAGVFGNAILKSVRKKREYRQCRAMLAKLKREQENLRSHAWSCPQSCPICLEDFTVQPPWRGGDRAPSSKDKAGDEASSSSAAAGPSGSSGLDAEAGPSTSLLHGREVTSEEEFARMSATGRAAVRRLHQRRRAGEAGGSSGGGGAGPSGSGNGWAEGAGPSTAAAGGGDGAADGRKERVPVTLGCGHTFCEPCIETWLDKGTTCPVCRKPISEGSGAESGGDECPSAQRANVRLADDWLATDLAFRLGVLQMRYPTYITPVMVDEWTSEAQSTGTFNWEGHRDFQLSDPAARHHYESSGQGGFSGSFGGGSGFGGGGGGGSW